MSNIVTPEAIPIQQIISSNYSLSPNNYKLVSVKNSKVLPLRNYLDEKMPYSQGIEPGSIAYVNHSSVGFLRNSCITRYNMNYSPSKIIFLNPRYDFSTMIEPMDVLLCKDANIGESCLFINYENSVYTHSSGVLRLNFKSDAFKFYCLAFLKDDYFLQQLDSMTPRGSTMRHAGEKFLDCLIPLPLQESDWLFAAFDQLTKNIAYSEYWCHRKTVQTNELIDKELMIHNVEYEYPTIDQIVAAKRLDAALYSPEVHALFLNIQQYPWGHSSLQEVGFELKRGPNLAKRDLGRSIQSSKYKKNFNVLIYPSDISDAGYVLRSSYIGARNPIWFLGISDILFAAEGTVGKTFIICDQNMRFTTNFHGTIISPIEAKTPIERSIFLGQFLSYLRVKGIFSRLAVGGQGGSFAIGYWDTIRIPNFPDDVVSQIASLYHSPVRLNPLEFDINGLAAAGIFELNEFRIVCRSVIDVLCSDIKSCALKSQMHYQEYADSL